MKFLVDFINSVSEVPKESMDKFLSLIRLKELKKGDSIALSGEVPKDFYIIKSGIIRSFYVNEKGKEYIRHFFTSLRTTGALGALVLDKPSRLSYDCLSACEIYAINYKDFKTLISKDKELCNMYVTILELIFLTLESRIYDLSVLNATDRYLKLKKQIPDIENIIPQYHIASFLNITPVQLSRIRKEIYSK